LSRQEVLVVGLGEVGQPLFELLKETEKFALYGYDVNTVKMRVVTKNQGEIPRKTDILHVCFPCVDQEEFVETVANYANQFCPKLIIIHSTIPPGTTMKIRDHCGCLVAHSPVRGVHTNIEHMKQELKSYVKFVGGADTRATQLAEKHFKELGLRTKALKSCTETELAKLFETTYRAWMIVCFQEMHRIAKIFTADFDHIAAYLEDTHRERLDRPVMFPGMIGGHCLIPNVKLLLESFDSRLLKLILESNEIRKEELKDKEILAEAEKIKRRAEALEKELLKGRH